MAKRSVIDHDRYIENIAKSKVLFEAAEHAQSRERRKTIDSLHPNIKRTALIALILALAMNISLIGNTMTGQVIREDPITKTIYIGFDAKLAKDTYTLGEPVTITIEPPNANYSIAVITPSKNIVMVQNLTYIPEESGRHRASILLYMYGLTERITLAFDVGEKR